MNLSKSEENELMWEQFITESPWLTQPIPDKFTSDMLKIDVEDIKSLTFLGNLDQFNIFQKIDNSFTELYFIKNEEIVSYYRYSELDTGGIQTKMIWNNPKYKGSFLKIFIDYIIPRFKVVESDDMLSQSAYDMWKKLIGLCENYKFYAKVKNKLIPMTGPYDVYNYQERFDYDGNSTFIVSVD